jgi:phage-related protein
LYKIIFYEDENNKSELIDYIKKLEQKSVHDKNKRIKLSKIMEYISFLEQYGTRIGKPTVKYLEDSLWELRPTNDRIIFFYWIDNNFVFLHHFKKTTQKTPRKEIEKAKVKMKNFLVRRQIK